MKVRELIEGYLNDILGLHPTDTEITAFRKSLINDHGIITAGDGRTDLRLPFIHETWRKKWGGRTHIDMGDSNGQIHLMLNKFNAPFFIEFIKEKRKI